MKNYFSFARKIDPQYHTNKWVLILVPLLFAAGVIYSLIVSAAFVTALKDGLYLSGHFFFAWAIARELDPDYDYSAFVAGAIAVGVWLLGNNAGLLINFFLLLLLRLASQSVGRPWRTADWLLLFTSAIWVAILGKFYVLPLLSIVAFADLKLTPKNKGSLIPALAGVVLSAISFYFVNWPILNFNELTLQVFGAMSILILFLVFTTKEISSVADFTKKPLHLIRIRLALWVSLLVVGVEIFLYELPGLWTITPLAAAICGVAFYRPIGLLKNNK